MHLNRVEGKESSEPGELEWEVCKYNSFDQTSYRGWHIIKWIDTTENGALLLRLGLPLTHWNPSQKRNFSKTLLERQRNLKTPAFGGFSVDRERFENVAFRKRWRYENHDIPGGGGHLTHVWV